MNQLIIGSLSCFAAVFNRCRPGWIAASVVGLTVLLEVTPAGGADSDPALGAAVKELLRTRCVECHGGSSTSGGIELLDTAAVRDKELVTPGKPEDSRLYPVIVETDEDVRMPQGQPPLSSDEIELIRSWIAGGAADLPADVAPPAEKTDDGGSGAEYVLEQIVRHQRSVPVEDRSYIRYFSAHHFLSAGATRAELNRQYAALVKTLNHHSYSSDIVRPAVVNEDVATVFALDLRLLGWHRSVATRVSPDENAVEHLNCFDLVLLEYPYGIVIEDSPAYSELADTYLRASALLRPVPYLRSDWFCSVATQPPLYHDLLQLPRTLGELEQQLGIDTADNLKQRLAKRAAMAVSGVSRNNRAVERHPHRHGSYWKSFDYVSSKGRDNIFSDPLELIATGGEMIFNLPNGLQAYYISDGNGTRLDFAPTTIVTDKFAEDKTVRNGLSCIRCHDRGIKDFRDEVRPAVEAIRGSGRIDKQTTLALYPERKAMDELVSSDQRRFLDAIEEALGTSASEEPLTAVSKRFLESPLQLTTVAGELGLIGPAELKTIVRQPQLTGLGLVALGNAGAIRRDMWEDHFDQVVHAMGLGIPVVPLDGLTRPDYHPAASALDVRLSTSRKNNVFSPGDELTIFVENRGSRPVFVELYGTSSKGEIAPLLPAGTKVEAASRLQFPQSGTLTVKPALGQETITLFASETAFTAGSIYRGTNVADRLVHNFYAANGTAAPGRHALQVVKHTLVIETR